jgi:precorrin-3B synthase
METGDGLLARFTPRDSITPAAFIAFCTAARRHGNGTIEITARGSLQVRGLSPDSAAHFAADVAALEIAASEGVPVIEDPLADDPYRLIDAADLAARLRRAIAEARLVLAPKVCVIIDGGGRLHLDALAADVRLRAIGPSAAPRLYIAVGGTAASAAPLGSIAPGAAVQAVVTSLGVIAARGSRARAVDVLHSAGIEAFRSALDGNLEPEPGPRPLPRLPTDPVGKHPLRDGSTALGTALPFGHAHAEALAELMRAAVTEGVRTIRPAPGRALLLIGASAAAKYRLAAAAEQLGFIVRAADPRRRIIACPGKPACASGLIASRALAAELARHVPSGGDAIHVSGCSKGCAHPGAAALTVIGTERGCGIVRHGSAAATPRHYVDPADLVGEIMRIIDTRETVHA